METLTNSNIPAKALNASFFEKLAAGNTKEAQQAGTDYTRLTLREEGLMRRIIPPQTITSADLDKQIDTDKPVKIIDKEVNQPLSATVPFGTLPENQYMRGARYRVDFARLVTKNYVKDIRELEQYDYDIRDIFKNNAIKDHMIAEDVPFFAAVEAIVGNTAMSPSPYTGKVQYYDFSAAAGNPLGTSAGFTRETVVESLKIMRKKSAAEDATVAVPVRLHPALIIMNVNTGAEYLKLGRDAVGGDASQLMFQNGLTEGTFFGIKHIFTIKDDLVPDGVAYQFAEPQFLGRFFELEAPTMFIDKRAYMMEFFVYSCIGSSIGNCYGVAKIKFF